MPPASENSIILDLLRRKQGVTLAEIAKATDRQNHSIRGFISGTLGKKMGIKVESTKNEVGERTCRPEARRRTSTCKASAAHTELCASRSKRGARKGSTSTALGYDGNSGSASWWPGVPTRILPGGTHSEILPVGHQGNADSLRQRQPRHSNRPFRMSTLFEDFTVFEQIQGTSANLDNALTLTTQLPTA